MDPKVHFPLCWAFEDFDFDGMEDFDANDSVVGSENPFGTPYDKNREVMQHKSENKAMTRPESPLFEPMDTSTRRAAEASFEEVPDATPTTNIDGFQRSRQLKASLSAPLISKGHKKRVEEDPENKIIKDLRQNHNMAWSAIANFLNEERLKRGEAPRMTQPAVYSRFVRNAPRIAAATGEVGFDTKDYMYLRHSQQFPIATLGVPGVEGGQDSTTTTTTNNNNNNNNNNKKKKKRPRAMGEPSSSSKEAHGNVRKKTKIEECAELETEEKTEQLVHAVETIERNFWVFVADELERTSGKMFDPKVLAGRYHAI